MRQPRRPTSSDVAARAGVSRTTVSFVLNDRANTGIAEETRVRVLQAAADLGYHAHGAARALAGGLSMAIGLVLLQTPDQVAADALLAETLLGIADSARADGYRVLVEAVSPDGPGYSDVVRSRGVDGLIISGPREDDAELRGIVRDGFPVILQGSLPGLPASSVDVDNRTGAAAAVAHLVGLGHRRIGIVTNAPLNYTSAEDRLAGYRDALRAGRITLDDNLVAEGAFDAASGRSAMADLLRRAPDLTAVFVASDIVAFGALRAIREAGRRVPDDVSIVGFDDVPLARHFDPPLTTVRLPARDLGAAAGRALIDRMAGRPVSDRTLLPTELVVRESTGSPLRGIASGSVKG
jgi:DNA-binding LacI/PurR family transcriptional regulator